MAKSSPTGSYRDDFLSLLKNKDKTRKRGFVVFVHGVMDLAPLAELCFEQTWNKCMTVRYGGADGHLIIPLFSRLSMDASYHADALFKKGPLLKRAEPVGVFLPDPRDGIWGAALTGIASASPGYFEPGGELKAFEAVFSAIESTLNTGERLVLFCEVKGLDAKSSLEQLGFTKEFLAFLVHALPERFGLVLSGIPEGLRLEGFGEQFLAIDPAGQPYGAPASEEERNQPLRNDEPAGGDRLNIEAEVNALADAVAAEDMSPPLVIGIFGSWGSGKSFVLHLLEERLLDIRCKDLSTSEKRKRFPYVGHTYLVHFDAWTYAKTNLWASLMQQILAEINHQISMEQSLWKADKHAILGDKAGVWKLLRKLTRQEYARLEETEVGKSALETVAGLKNAELEPEVLWNRLRDLTKVERDNLNKAEQSLSNARRRLAQAEDVIERMADQAMQVQAGKTSWKVLRPQVVGRLAAPFTKTLDELLAASDPKPELSFETVAESIGLFKRFVAGFNPKTFGILGLAVVLGSLGFVAEAAAGKTLGAFGGLSGLLVAALEAVKTANTWLRERLDDFDRLTRETLERQDGIRKQLVEQTRKERNMDGMERRVRALEAKVETHRRNIGITARHETLLDFLRGRLDRGDYEKHLGLLQQVQQDVDELSDTLLSERFVPNPDPFQGEDLFPRGKPRVVLIIDDLDRCPPERVVEVLEAAQLLVKTSLFVVVLAMDVRYVTRSLEKSYEGVLVRDGTPSGLDYIEKIVQIPYRVRPIDGDAMPGYISSQLTARAQKKQSPTQTGDGGAISISGESGTITAPDPDSGRMSASLPTEIQQFDDAEIGVLEKCALAAEVTPRATKRLVNVLKLIKIIWYRTATEEPGLDVKQAMVLLLTLAARYPEVMKRHLIELEYRCHEAQDGSASKRLATVMNGTRKVWSVREGRKDDWEAVAKLAANQNLLNPSLTTKTLSLRDIRLVRSFSFVGELDVPRERETEQPAVEMKPAADGQSAPARA